MLETSGTLFRLQMSRRDGNNTHLTCKYDPEILALLLDNMQQSVKLCVAHQPSACLKIVVLNLSQTPLIRQSLKNVEMGTCTQLLLQSCCILFGFKRV